MSGRGRAWTLSAWRTSGACVRDADPRTTRCNTSRADPAWRRSRAAPARGGRRGLQRARWQLFAQATAANGVQSTLTLPILAGDRVTATEAPRQLQASAKISTAVGVICAQLDVDEDEARRLLRDAAACAGASELRVAEALLSSWEDLDDSSDR
jgi:hypothetical protein